VYLAERIQQVFICATKMNLVTVLPVQTIL
jgi:hypothetical protein